MSGKHIIKNLVDAFINLSRTKKVIICTTVTVLCFIVIGGIILAGKLNKIDSNEIAQDDIMINEDLVASEGYTNIALFGIDSRTGELEKGTRTDCLIVASLNNETKEVKMVSVYRDTVLDIEENYLQKCNAAYAFGGPTQAINMLNRNLDLNIQDYVTVDFAAIANVIDLLGGLEIDIKEEEVKPINKYVKETAKVAGKTANKIEGAGLQQLDGVQATTYARIRSTAGGDFTRTERQRLVIEKIVEKAQKTDLATINKIIDELLPTIKTSFTPAEILAYAQHFTKYQIGDSSGFPFEKTTATIAGLGSIVIPVTLEDNVKQLHEFFFGDASYTPSEVVSTVSSAIVNRVGQREATDYGTLSAQTYVDTEEDKAQEKNEYAPPTKEEMEADKTSNKADVKSEEERETNKDENNLSNDDETDVKLETDEKSESEKNAESDKKSETEKKPDTSEKTEADEKSETESDKKTETSVKPDAEEEPDVKPEANDKVETDTKPEVDSNDNESAGSDVPTEEESGDNTGGSQNDAVEDDAVDNNDGKDSSSESEETIED